MAEQDTASIPTLIRSLMDDARELIREELALARAEMREELSAARGMGVSFGAAALLAVIGVVLLCIALGGAVADVLDLPAWAGYGIMALLLGGAAYVFLSRGRRQLAAIRGLPRTQASLRENIAWIRSRSSRR